MVRRLRFALAGAAVLLVLALDRPASWRSARPGALTTRRTPPARVSSVRRRWETPTPRSSALLAVAAVRSTTPRRPGPPWRPCWRDTPRLVATSAPVGAWCRPPRPEPGRHAPGDLRRATTSSRSSTSPPDGSWRATTPTDRVAGTSRSCRPARSSSAPTAAHSQSAARPTPRPAWCSWTVRRSHGCPTSLSTSPGGAPSRRTSPSPPTDVSSPPRSCSCHLTTSRWTGFWTGIRTAHGPWSGTCHTSHAVRR